MSHPVPGPSRELFSQLSADPYRLSNIHHGFSPFLDQLSQGKDAMSLVHELSHLHRVKPEYELTDVSGPDHAKSFTVYLKLDTEKHIGQGSSIRSAQQNAAKVALINTRLKFPMRNKDQRKAKPPTGNKKPPGWMAARMPPAGGESKKDNPGPRFESVPRYPFRPDFVPMNNRKQPLGSTYGMIPYAPVPFMAMPPAFQPVANYPYIPSNIPYFSPRYCYDPFTNKHYFVHELANPGYIPAMCYPHPMASMAKNHNHNHRDPSTSNNKVQIKSESVESKLGDDLFVANVEFEGTKFSGYGKSSREARHSAAEKALVQLKSDLFKSLKVDDATEIVRKPEKEDQNPVSLLYTMAARNRQKLIFSLIDSYGQVHMPIFLFRCRLLDASNDVILESEGKDRSKKAAKRRAAENMLRQIKDSQDLNENSIQQQGSDDSECLNFGCSNKCLTKLYDVARNMLLANPTFRYQKLNAEHVISKKFATMASSSEPGIIHRIECILLFDETKCHISVNALGFGRTQRLAKQVASFIALLKMGLEPPRLEPVSDDQFLQSLKFSLLENRNLNENLMGKTKRFAEEDLDSLDIFYESDKNVITDLRDNQERFQINYRFVMFVLKKFYYYTLRDAVKQVDCINEKMKFLLANFKNSNTGSLQFDHLDETRIMEMISGLDMQKYWDHLKFLENVIVIGTDLQPGSVIKFSCHVCSNETPDLLLAIVNVRLNDSLTRENFQMIRKNFAAYGFGINEEEAREAAALRTLDNMASNAFKDSLANHQTHGVMASVDDDSNPTKMKIASRPSANQMKSKQCISYMYQVCQDLFIKKPEFICSKYTAGIENEPELFICRCLVEFKQDHKQLYAKLVFVGIGGSKRTARTIAAFIFLSNLNTLNFSSFSLDVFNIAGFEKYLQLSMKENRYKNFHPDHDDEKIFYHPEQLEQINQNIEFFIHLLKEIYRPFLKNQKRNDPTRLFVNIAEKLFEYHNHRKQLADKSDSFDRWSENVRRWVDEVMARFRADQYWDHLQLLSLIGSTLNSNLDRPLDPPPFRFKCQLIEAETETDSVVTTTTTIAIINLHSNATFHHQYPVFQKEFLSFSMDHEPSEARELASYKALRYFAINFWK